MGNRYITKRDAVTPGSGVDVLTIQSIASRRVRIVEVAVAGRGVSSAAQQIEVGRMTGGSTSGGTITPGKFDHTDQPLAAAIYITTWGTQPTPDTNAEVIGWNALGGANRWIPPKGTGLEVRNGEGISFRVPAGVTPQAMSLSVTTEED